MPTLILVFGIPDHMIVLRVLISDDRQSKAVYLLIKNFI